VTKGNARGREAKKGCVEKVVELDSVEEWELGRWLSKEHETA